MRASRSPGYDEHAAAVTMTAAVLTGAGFGTPLSWQTEIGGSRGPGSGSPRSGSEQLPITSGASRACVLCRCPGPRLGAVRAGRPDGGLGGMSPVPW